MKTKTAAQLLYLQTRAVKSTNSGAVSPYHQKNTKEPMTQADLFSLVFPSSSSSSEDLSHIIQEWDLIPIYGVSRRAQDSIRSPAGNLPVLKRKCKSISNESYTVAISPAKIVNSDGSYKEYYPAATEELIADVLRKISLDQHYGSHLPTTNNSMGISACTFSLNMIREELKKQKRQRSPDEIMLSIDILHKCSIEITKNGKASYSGPIFPERVIANRDQYLSDTSILSTVTFSSIINRAIDNLEYRQFRYDTMTALKSQLARWVFKFLNVKYTNAGGSSAAFKLNYLEVKELSGLLDAKDVATEVRLLEQAVKDLEKAINFKKERKVLSSYKKDTVKKGSSIVDATFNLTPSPEFIDDMIAANSRNKVVRNIPILSD